MRARTWVWLLIIAIIVGILYVLSNSGTSVVDTPHQVASANFACSEGKTISAIFFESSSTPAVTPGEPPVHTGSVALTLSDGRTMTLPRTLSADGGRYANADESIIFWTAGNGATVTEGTRPTYTCIFLANDPGGVPQVFEGGSQGFTLRYPSGYSVAENYAYQAFGPGKDIGGVKFTIASTTAEGTNLSMDSYVSVEQIPQAKTCNAGMFLEGAVASELTDGDITYSFASSTGAAAGNRYDESVYVLSWTNPCVAVRYFIHYAAFENFPEGTVKQFDRASLIAQFDLVRKSLVIDQ